MTSMMAIYDTMQFIQPEITTCCIGQEVSCVGSLASDSVVAELLALNRGARLPESHR